MPDPHRSDAGPGGAEHPDGSDDTVRDADPRRLGMLVEAEARRALSESQLEGDPDLLAAGWERRFIADEARAGEATELYEKLGYEVCADPVRAEELEDDCEDCLLVARLRFVTIYTRRPGGESE